MDGNFGAHFCDQFWPPTEVKIGQSGKLPFWGQNMPFSGVPLTALRAIYMGFRGFLMSSLSTKPWLQKGPENPSVCKLGAL